MLKRYSQFKCKLSSQVPVIKTKRKIFWVILLLMEKRDTYEIIWRKSSVLAVAQNYVIGKKTVAFSDIFNYSCTKGKIFFK